MDPKYIDAIKILIDKRVSNLDYLYIGWFGGEPLLGMDIVLQISSFIVSLTKKNSNLIYKSGMSTNGYLLSLETAEKLIKNGVTEFQISLDGPKFYHDKVRKLKNGRGTYNRIINNLLELKKSSLNFQINIRMHISKNNISYLDEMVDLLINYFANDSRFKYFFKTIVPLGGENDSNLQFFNNEEAKRIEQKYSSKLLKNIQPVIGKDSNYICYAARPNFFVIRSNGSVTKCTVGLDEDNNQVGYLSTDGNLKINQSKNREWLKGAVALNSEWLSCPRAYL